VSESWEPPMLLLESGGALAVDDGELEKIPAGCPRARTVRGRAAHRVLVGRARSRL